MDQVTRETLRPLLDLQRIDSSIDKLTARRADLPEQHELDEIVGRRNEAADALVTVQTELDSVAREQSRIEADVETIGAKITHEQARLYSGEVTNAKELSNIQAELDALRRRKAHLEDQELDVMERREAIDRDETTLSATLAELDAGVAEATARRDAAAADIAAQLADLGAARDALVPTVPAEGMTLYEDLRMKRGGIAVGAYEGGMCRACGLPLSPLAREEIRENDDPFVRCENCRRLLIVA